LLVVLFVPVLFVRVFEVLAVVAVSCVAGIVELAV
jgi:hypothetical protein